MEEITLTQLKHLKNRYPEFELSYESMLHNKVPQNYEVHMAIPTGKKYIAWFTFEYERNVLYLFELNKDKKIAFAYKVPMEVPLKLAYGTILYGTFLEFCFVIEDIHFYMGINVCRCCLYEKLQYLHEVFRIIDKMPHFEFVIPYMSVNNDSMAVDIENVKKLSYNIHHIQYRSLYKITPYLNHVLSFKIEQKKKSESLPIFTMPIKMDFRKPAYKSTCVFLVSANLQFDVYNLYAFGKQSSKVFYNVAYIPDYDTSVKMNSIFRNIKENRNLDAIEESDDEEEFENPNIDKFVDLQKIIPMKCIYMKKFRKWKPIEIAHNQKIIHVSAL